MSDSQENFPNAVPAEAGAQPSAIVLMGVCGCGKTEVGKQLATLLGSRFFDGDDYHPPENVEKMSRGEPLCDADRLPWNTRMREEILSPAVKNRHQNDLAPVILAASALRRPYRETLIADLPRESVWFVHLHGSEELILQRMRSRQGHFMKEGMVASQFAALEPPYDDECAIDVCIEDSPADIAKQIVAKLGLRF